MHLGCISLCYVSVRTLLKNSTMETKFPKKNAELDVLAVLGYVESWRDYFRCIKWKRKEYMRVCYVSNRSLSRHWKQLSMP
jgi:hypothetical protein